MNLYKKIANEAHEERASMTSRDWSKHGLTNVARRAKRKEARLDMDERCNEDRERSTVEP